MEVGHGGGTTATSSRPLQACCACNTPAYFLLPALPRTCLSFSCRFSLCRCEIRFRLVRSVRRSCALMLRARQGNLLDVRRLGLEGAEGQQLGWWKGNSCCMLFGGGGGSSRSSRPLGGGGSSMGHCCRATRHQATQAACGSTGQAAWEGGADRTSGCESTCMSQQLSSRAVALADGCRASLCQEFAPGKREG
jgi:hypothetical protein